MLCQFSFKNFKCFKNESTLDLCAENISEHKSSLIFSEFDNEEFLPVISIYGPNGGGKTSVLEAFAYVRRKILKPILVLSEGDIENKKTEKGLELLPINEKQKFFKFSPECENIPTEFSIICRIKGFEYKYSISFVNDVIVDEKMFAMDLSTGEPEFIFERTENSEEYSLGECLDGMNLDKVSKKLSFLSHISVTADIELIDNFVEWLANCTILNYDNPIRDRSFNISFMDNYKKRMIGYLNDMDIGISDIRFEKNEADEVKDVYTVHPVKNGKTSELLFEDESSGTRKLLSLLPMIIEALENGSLVIADEMDAKLHPKLFGFIISLFTDPNINTKNAQLICTSHDISNMNNKMFRRDEIWFSAQNANNEATLYSLVQFRLENGTVPRKDSSYAKQYLEGRYGADPYIKRIFEWED